MGFPSSSVGKESACNVRDPSSISGSDKGQATHSSILGLPNGPVDKKSSCNVGDQGFIPGLGRSPGEVYGKPFQYGTQSSILAWRIPMDRGTWEGAIIHGLAMSRTRLRNSLHFTSYTHTHTPCLLYPFIS